VTSLGPQSDQAWATVVSSNNTVVFTTGLCKEALDRDALTIANLTSTGDNVWETQTNLDLDERMYVIATNPNGSLVFASGTIGPDATSDMLTIAYNAHNGTVNWTKRYHGGFGRDVPHDISVTPDGSMVLVTGNSEGGANNSADFLTVAYDAKYGQLLWEARSNRANGSFDNALEAALNPAGTWLFVTGPSQGTTLYRDYWTVAYEFDTSSVVEKWNMAYGNPLLWDETSGIEVTPDGSYVFVTGRLGNETDAGTDFGTIRYEASTGAEAGVNVFSQGRDDYAQSLAISPDGWSVYVAGHTGALLTADYVTVAYNASTFVKKWDKTYNFQDNDDHAIWVVVSPDSQHALVAGTSKNATAVLPGTNYDFAVVTYHADGSSPTPDAVRYDGDLLGGGIDYLYGIAMASNGQKFFVAGYSEGDTTGEDWAIVGYDFP
jgi:hypothetical protein